MAASSPKRWFHEKWRLVCRNKQENRKVLPITTCIQWNPVATKDVLYFESANVNEASIYSYLVCMYKGWARNPALAPR
jgi:hypothetical protein